MIEQAHRNGYPKAARAPEARYSYYRRCQLFRRNGDQCKAPAEKGEAICHAHAAQQAMAMRRERKRKAVLAEAVAEMRRRERPECEMADLFMDFKGIQVTLAVMAQALIDGRIDCKTAGRLVVELQTMSKLLWLYHRDHRGTQREKALTTKDTRSTSFSQAQGRSGQAPEDEGLAGLRMLKECEQSGSANRMRSAEIIVIRRTGGAGTHAERVHGPPDVVRAA